MRHVSIAGIGLVVLAVAGPAAAAPAAAVKAVPFVDFSRPVAPPPVMSNGPGNDRDVVKARIESDGSNILMSATLSEDEHGTIAGAVLKLYLDIDNNPRTGGAASWGEHATPPKTGYEYLAQLSVCMAWNENIGACAGGVDTPPKSRHARVLLDRFKGAAGATFDMMSRESLISGFGPAQDPFKGRVLQGKVPYDKLGVKPGQTIRVTTWAGGGSPDEGFFADVLLALR
jgi:hypothetical protein